MRTWFLVVVLANVVAVGCSSAQKKAPSKKEEPKKATVDFYWPAINGRTTGN
jgi:uncharacterized protein YcfL